MGLWWRLVIPEAAVTSVKTGGAKLGLCELARGCAGATWAQRANASSSAAKGLSAPDKPKDLFQQAGAQSSRSARTSEYRLEQKLGAPAAPGSLPADIGARHLFQKGMNLASNYLGGSDAAYRACNSFRI